MIVEMAFLLEGLNLIAACNISHPSVFIPCIGSAASESAQQFNPDMLRSDSNHTCGFAASFFIIVGACNAFKVKLFGSPDELARRLQAAAALPAVFPSLETIKVVLAFGEKTAMINIGCLTSYV
ncbi:MAG: hypothetical protein PUE64_09560 [Firmicutes bacterium]|nr:hypothetical protein [Bacillota bacterium]